MKLNWISNALQKFIFFLLLFVSTKLNVWNEVVDVSKFPACWQCATLTFGFVHWWTSFGAHIDNITHKHAVVWFWLHSVFACKSLSFPQAASGTKIAWESLKGRQDVRWWQMISIEQSGKSVSQIRHFYVVLCFWPCEIKRLTTTTTFSEIFVIRIEALLRLNFVTQLFWCRDPVKTWEYCQATRHSFVMTVLPHPGLQVKSSWCTYCLLKAVGENLTEIFTTL